MISLYSGTPGSGKSLHLARRLYYKIRANQPVICNFPLALDKISKKPKDCFTYVDNSRLTPAFLENYAQDYWKNKGGKVKEDTIFLVIDEAQLLFNSRDWGKTDRKDWLAFFTLHRHLGYEIILCCQFDRMLDRQIRGVIEYEHIHRKVKNFGWKGWLFNFFAGGNLHVSVQMWYPLRGEKLGSEFYKCKKKYYRIYDTFLLFNDDQQDKQVKLREGGAKLGDPPEDLTDGPAKS